MWQILPLLLCITAIPTKHASSKGTLCLCFQWTATGNLRLISNRNKGKAMSGETAADGCLVQREEGRPEVLLMLTRFKKTPSVLFFLL